MIFIVAGEASGDQLGEELLKELYRLNPDLKVKGVGGPKMRAVGMETVYPMEELQVMGFIDVLLALPHLWKCFRKTVKAILKDNPQVVVTIDYPGFNLRLAKTLRKKGFKGKICHYVCPSVWAWGKKRIDLMGKHLDLLLSVLPFEKELFAKTALQVEYIGHPLAQKIAPLSSHDQNLVALFPGSRTKEIERNFPFFIRLIDALKQEFPNLKYVVSLAQEKYRPLLEGHPLATPQEIEQLKPFLAIAKSGTVSLELALKQIPSVVTYAISPLDLFLATYVFKIKLPFYALPNLIARKTIFPELIGPSLSDGNLYREVKNLITDRPSWEKCQKSCQALRENMGSENVSRKAAELILSLKESKISP
jgi:lipid-A-disaccharide synthase